VDPSAIMLRSMKRRIFRIWITFAIVAGLLALPAQAASFKHWRSSIKAAQDARKKRDFTNARAILESVATEAAELGPESSAENSWTLAEVFFDERQFDEALNVVNPALEKIGPKPVKREIQLWRGILLSAKASCL
jgi:hypothetical protein